MRCTACREKIPKYERYCLKCGEANPWMIGRTVEQVRRRNLVDWLMVLVPIAVGLVGGRLIRGELGEWLAIMATLFLEVICPIHFIRRYRNRPDRVYRRKERAAQKRQRRLTKAYRRSASAVNYRPVPTIQQTFMEADDAGFFKEMAKGGLWYAAAGPLGALHSIKHMKHTVQFTLLWSDGSRTKEIVKLNSPRYEELIQYLS